MNLSVKIDYDYLLRIAIEVSLKAGETIMEVYDSEFSVEEKQDKSPLTLADKKSHEIISAFLNKMNLPVLSEEGKDIPYEVRKNWELFWLVDPLDGTKEFIKRNGEFTVNIALIEKNRPIMGVIYAPVLKSLYYALKGTGAYKISNVSTNGKFDFEELKTHSEKLPLDKKRDKYTIVASRSHLSKETENYINELKGQHGDIELISAGSSLKFCLVAEGKADEYPRFGPTMEWDTAAGQSIVEGIGRRVISINEDIKLNYNKVHLKNSFFKVVK